MSLRYRLECAQQRQNIIALGFWNVGWWGDWISHGKHNSRTAAVYFAERGDGLVKIGASDTPSKRAAKLRLELLGVIPNVGNFEGYLHDYFDGFRVEKEWFRPEPPLLAFIDRVNRTFPQEAPA